jgi:hypothetical protein
MASTVWKGHLTFGLVSIPVRLIRAARAERVKLRQLYRPSTPEQQVGTLPRREPPAAPPVSLEALPPSPPGPAERKPEVQVGPVRRVFQSADEDQPIASADLVKG